MTQLRPDVPWNLPEDWEIPAFVDGEMPELVQAQGIRLIGSQVALVKAGTNPFPVPAQIKAGAACWKLGFLFIAYRDPILEAIKRASKGTGS